jgi:hypothetical protein
MGIERRKFIRHPLSYPISTRVVSEPAGIEPAGGGEGGGRNGDAPRRPGNCGPEQGAARVSEMVSHSENIGAGGILYLCERGFAEGTGVRIDLQVEKRRFTLDGKVVRVEKSEGGKFGIAVAFNAPSEVLKVRMMEQIVRIELFKSRLERRFKTELDFAAVAKEWIRRYSKIFAERYDL